MGEIFALSNAEWEKAEGRINKEYKEWQTEFAETYEDNISEWEANYDEFLNQKNAWVTEQYLYAINSANAPVIENSGADVDSTIAATLRETLSVNGMAGHAFEGSGYVDRLLGDTNLAKLMATAGNIQDRANGAGALVAKGTARDASGWSSIASAALAVADISEEMRKTASLLAASQARKQFEQIKKQYASRIDSENEGMEKWETKMVRSSGYTVSGDSIKREAIIGSTIAGALTETQKVHKYRDFKAAEATVSVGLDDESLAGLDDHGVMTLLGQAKGELEAYGEKIFGAVDKDGKTKEWKIPRASSQADVTEYQALESKDSTKKTLAELEEYEAKDYDAMSDSEKEKYGKLMNSIVSVRDGELGQHIGFAGEFKSGESLDLTKSRSSNVKYEGKGEIGAIMLDFQWNSMMEGKGIADLGKPVYDQALWDSRGMPFEAPTIRSTTEIAVAIAASAVATVVSGGTLGPVAAMLVSAAVSAAVNLSDDLVFAGLDLAGGYKTPEQVGNELGKKAATAAVSSAVGVGSGALGAAAEGLTGGLKVAADMGIAGGQSAINTVAGSAINSFDFSTGKFDANAFTSSMSSISTWSGTFASMAGAGVASGLKELNLGQKIKGVDGTASSYTKVDGFNSGQIGSILALDNFAGSLASTAVTYGMTGNASFNLARVNGVGLLEMNVGKDGFGMKLGMGGTDISFGTIANAMAGAQNWDMNNKINAAANRNEMASASTALRTQWGFGDAAAKAQLGSILDGSTVLRAGDTALGAETAQTTLENGQRVVTLNGYKEGMTREEQLALGITMQHEAYRDGVVNGNNQLETIYSVYGHTTMAEKMLNDKAYSGAMGNVVARSATLGGDLEALRNGDMQAFANHVLETYDSSADYWKIIMHADGTHEVVDDHKKELSIQYFDENGSVIGGYTIANQPSMNDVGRAGALARELSPERIESLLGSSLSNVDLYDFQSLKDILKGADGKPLSDAAIKQIQHNDQLPANLTEAQKLSLAGEALLKHSGMSWDAAQSEWTGGNLHLTSRTLEGGIMANVNAQGKYVFSTVEMEIQRDPASYFVRNTAAAANASYKGLDSIVITQRDLDGNQIAQQTFNNFTTVQTMLGTEWEPGNTTTEALLYNHDRFLPFTINTPYGQYTTKVGPETVRAGDVAYKFMSKVGNSVSTQLFQGDYYLQAAMGDILANRADGTPYTFNAWGNAGYDGGDHLQHPTQNAGNLGCLVTKDVAGLTGKAAFTAYTDYLYGLGVRPGYVLYGQITHKNNPYYRVW